MFDKIKEHAQIIVFTVVAAVVTNVILAELIHAFWH